jgi:DNA repair protein RadA/Sms
MKCYACSATIPEGKQRCPACSSYQFTTVVANKQEKKGDGVTVLLSEIDDQEIIRIKTGPWDYCFGGNGIPLSSVTLIGGMPGAGKSTIALQISDCLSQTTQREVLYIGTEQRPKELRAYAVRLKVNNMNKIRILSTMTGDEGIGQINEILDKYKPSAIMVDSLSGFTDDTKAQIQVCKVFKEFACRCDCPVLIIDHITKSNDFAGLMALQHEVDILLTLYIEEGGERTLQTLKSRFGPSYIQTALKMTETGLIADPDRQEQISQSHTHDKEENEEEDE